MSAEEVVAAYAAAWNETDASARLTLLQGAWADDGVYCDPTALVKGRDALVAHIGDFHAGSPGARIDAASGVDGHHGWIRFAWTMVAPDGATVVDGFDVAELDADGRIVRLVGFFGPFPASES